MSAIANFLARLIDERDALSSAVHADAESLRWAKQVWLYRRHPLTIADPAWMLEERTVKHGNEMVTLPPNCTEEDVKRYGFNREGNCFPLSPEERGDLKAGEIPQRLEVLATTSGQTRTDLLLRRLRPAIGFTVVHNLLRNAISEAKTEGMAGTLPQLLTAAHDAHQSLLAATGEAAESGERNIGPAFTEHCEALSKLTPYLPAETEWAVIANEVDDETEMARALAVMPKQQLQILRVARDGDKSVDDRLREVARIDHTYYAKDSNELAVLIGCTASNIRQTVWWKIDRRNVLQKDE